VVSGRFISGVRPPGTPWIGWVGPRAGLDAEAMRKDPTIALPGTEPRSSSP